MTLQHLIRTMMVAGVAVAGLILAQQARAEGGEGAVLVVSQAVVTASADPSAPVSEEKSVEMVQNPTAVGSKRQRFAERDALRAAELKPLILRHASEQGIPFALADAIVRIESRYNTVARNGPNVGLTQINARTAQSLGYQGAFSGLLEAETNLRYGLKYLGQAYKLAGGDTCGTILRYQAGHRAQTMTNAARAYCARVKTIIATAE
jgi:soluble lytic murein transglycosylase-like protein